MRTLLPSLALATLAATLLSAPTGPAGAATAPEPTALRLDGIGPLTLGMSRTAAVRTGWLSDRGTGCPLGGPPVPVTYRLDGAAAPAGITGSAEFRGGRLYGFAFTRGVRTGTGVVPGRTTLKGMATLYRRAGFTVRVTASPIFRGTFVTVRRGGRDRIGAFGTGTRVQRLALPRVLTCD